MEPKLILLNGNPGMGKTTLAQRYIEEHPMVMNMDMDNIWIMMGGWDTNGSPSNELKFKYADRIIDMHLSEGYNVIVPQLMENIDRYETLEAIAIANNASLHEIVLISSMDDAIERCKARARAQGHPDGFRPGGVLDSNGREKKLESMYANMLATIALRPNMIRIESVEGDIDGTYAKVIDAISSVSHNL